VFGHNKVFKMAFNNCPTLKTLSDAEIFKISVIKVLKLYFLFLWQQKALSDEISVAITQVS